LRRIVPAAAVDAETVTAAPAGMSVMPNAQFVENILQSLSAGVLIGAIYGLMCEVGQLNRTCAASPGLSRRRR